MSGDSNLEASACPGRTSICSNMHAPALRCVNAASHDRTDTSPGLGFSALALYVSRAIANEHMQHTCLAVILVSWGQLWSRVCLDARDVSAIIAKKRAAVCRRDVVTKMTLNIGWLKRGANAPEVDPYLPALKRHKYTRCTQYMDNAKLPKDLTILRADCELRRQGARRRNRDLNAACLV
eukprot:6204965-Pleurochrysis_carterae.AAC.2